MSCVGMSAALATIATLALTAAPAAARVTHPAPDRGYNASFGVVCESGRRVWLDEGERSWCNTAAVIARPHSQIVCLDRVFQNYGSHRARFKVRGNPALVCVVGRAAL